MVSGHVFIAASLDGYIARLDGGIDWLSNVDTGTEDHGYDSFMESVDGIVMGRGSFETVRGFDPWPYQKPVVVMSRRLTEDAVPAALRGKVRLTRGTPTAVMTDLGARGWTRAYIDGGQMIQSFLRDGLIDDVVLTWVPILLGGGRPLFGSLSTDVALRHLGTESFPSGLVQSRYAVVKAGPG